MYRHSSAQALRASPKLPPIPRETQLRPPRPAPTEPSQRNAAQGLSTVAPVHPPGGGSANGDRARFPERVVLQIVLGGPPDQLRDGRAHTVRRRRAACAQRVHACPLITKWEDEHMGATPLPSRLVISLGVNCLPGFEARWARVGTIGSGRRAPSWVCRSARDPSSGGRPGGGRCPASDPPPVGSEAGSYLRPIDFCITQL